jgi:hypothetical protein
MKISRAVIIIAILAGVLAGTLLSGAVPEPGCIPARTARSWPWR